MSETKSPLGGLTRRGFLKTTGAVTAVAAVAARALRWRRCRRMRREVHPPMASRRSGAHAAATAVAAAPWR